MEKSTLKKLESIAHIALGFVAGIMNLRLLLTHRERNQLPPENDANPLLWVPYLGKSNWDWVKAFKGGAYGGKEYWGKERVMDTLNDSREYDIGGTIAWFVVLGGGIAIGKFLL
jgi:hypothetical protein